MSSRRGEPAGDNLRSKEYLTKLVDCLEILEAGSKTVSDNDESQTPVADNGSFPPETQMADMTEVREQVFNAFSEFNKYLQRKEPMEATDTLFGRTLSNCLQFICNCILHCAHQNEIYGSRAQEKDVREFITHLSLNCGTLSATCFEVMKKNMALLHKLNRKNIYEMMEMSTQCLILATDQPNALPSVAKVFAAMLRPFHHFYKSDSIELLSVGATMIKHLRELVETVLGTMHTDDKASTVQIKMVNYFGKLFTRFLAGFNLNGSEWRECFMEVMNTAKFAEEASSNVKEGVRVLDCYPGILSAFVNTPHFSKEVVTLTDEWETRLRVRVKLRVAVACSSALGSSEILTSIFHDVTHLYEDNSSTLSTPTLINAADPDILPQLREFVRGLNGAALERFQKDVLTFFIERWPETSSVIVADLITNIFAFIVQDLDEAAREEYLAAFSHPSLPPQLRYFVFPALVQHHPDKKEQVDFLTDAELVQKYYRILHRAKTNVLKAKDLEFFRLFWARLKDADSNTIMDKLLPICVDTANIMSYLDQATLSPVFLAAEEFLRNPTTLSIVGCCAILLGAKQLVFDDSSTWAAVSSICFKIICTCKQTRHFSSCVGRFTVKCVCSFMDELKVESEDMVLSLRSRLQGITSKRVESWKNSTPSTLPISDNKVEYLVPVLEKITNDIIESNVKLSQDERLRLTAAIAQLNEFMSRTS